jgi:hypothetical protein
MIVFNNEAWPGQSTKVYCKYYYFMGWLFWELILNFYGIRVKKAENPKSKVIPLYWDCGFLSSDAVEVI